MKNTLAIILALLLFVSSPAMAGMVTGSGDGGGGSPLTDLDDLPGDSTSNNLIDYDILQQICQNPLTAAPGSPYNGQMECSDGNTWQPGGTDQGNDDWLVIYRTSDTTWVGLYNMTDGVLLIQENVDFCVACSDESTDLTTGTAKRTFRMPFAMTVDDIRASVNTAPTGATITVDVNEAGATILTTKLTIDASEETSETAVTPAVIGGAGPALADDAEITIDIDQVGSTVAGTGLKVCFGGTSP